MSNVINFPPPDGGSTQRGNLYVLRYRDSRQLVRELDESTYRLRPILKEFYVDAHLKRDDLFSAPAREVDIVPLPVGSGTRRTAGYRRLMEAVNAAAEDGGDSRAFEQAAREAAGLARGEWAMRPWPLRAYVQWRENPVLVFGIMVGICLLAGLVVALTGGGQ